LFSLLTSFFSGVERLAELLGWSEELKEVIQEGSLPGHLAALSVQV
jgi:hypothetical protein